MVQKSIVLTNRELNVIDKKLKNKKLTQQDSNYLSRYVRPKLKELTMIDSKEILQRLEYNQKIPSIEKKIIQLILNRLKDVVSIALYGSVVHTNYHDYKDIDVLVEIKEKQWNKLNEKYKIINDISERAKKQGINLDLQIYDTKVLYDSYPSSPDMIYQLEDSKTIYGILQLPKKKLIPKLVLRMKLDYSIIDGDSSSIEIYKAIRNLWLVKLIIKKIVNNKTLLESLDDELGKNTIKKLKENKANSLDKKIALLYLNDNLNKTIKELNEARWEKLAL